MNILPCELSSGASHFAGNRLQTACTKLPENGSKDVEVGVRPEFVQFDDKGFPVEIVKVDDLGRHQIVVARHENNTIKMILAEGEAIPSESPRISFSPEHTRLYQNSWVVD
jgi:glycerol transport system ATP-binding protein